MAKTFDGLFRELQGRVTTSDPTPSNTRRLLDLGPHAIGKKLVEEAAEAWMAANYEEPARAAEELAQLVYHVQVMMLCLGLSLEALGEHL